MRRRTGSKRHAFRHYFAVGAYGLLVATASGATDLVVADFEGGDYGTWQTTGVAFGAAPATGAIEGQMPVSGFSGKSFASSFHGRDDSTGTLTSAPFKIERKYLNFLIGGGGFPGETCLNLLLDGRTVRTETGDNREPGGSEKLDSKSFDLTGLMGKSVTLQLVDARKGGWGHISLDQVVQSDVPAVLDIHQEFAVNQRYLVWPVSVSHDPKKRFFLTLDGEKAPFSFGDICLSNTPDFWVFTDLANFQGRKVTVTGKLPGSLADAWKKVAISSTFPGEDSLYKEPLRPQYHFSSRRGWLNDPNGLVWKDGVWQLCYQHNPYNYGWDNMTWGRATSRDLFHWTEQPTALEPGEEGTMYSGSAIVVPKGQGTYPAKGANSIAMFYTAAGTHSYVGGRPFTQGLAVSEDNGRTYRKFAGNPVIPHRVGENRDPKVSWYEPAKKWILNLYLDGNTYGLYTSTDLVKWEKSDDYQIPGEAECPDMFELPVDGDAKNTRYIVWGAHGKYRVGHFDGKKFTPDSGVQRNNFGDAYAGQTYANAPAGRRVHIGWMGGGGPGMVGAPFNQQMTLPMDFSLRSGEGGIRLWAEPSEEVVTLRENTTTATNLTWKSGDADPFATLKGGQFEIDALVDAEASTAAELGFIAFGQHLGVWKKSDQTFFGMEGKQPPINGKLHIHVFVDTVTIECFVNGSYTGRYIRQSAGKAPAAIVANGGVVKFDSLKVSNLMSVWGKK